MGPPVQRHGLWALTNTEHLADLGFVALLGLLYIGVSAGLIAYNKFLIHKDRFPFAVPLVLLHMACCSGFAGALYLAKPALFPSLSDPTAKVSVDRRLIFGGALPIAALFAVQLVLSNTAFLHSSVAFLQMMKESNLVLVYGLSLAAALERFSWRSFWLLVLVILATALTIQGEPRFSPTGFAIQGISQLFESLKIVLQAALLSSAGRKLDALSYVLIVCPLCFVLLSALLCWLMFAWPSQHFEVPHMADVLHWWPHLLINACVAFALNVVIAMFVKYSSAVALILVGVIKDASIVLAGGLLLREAITILQGFGFMLQLSAVLVYTLAKTFPEKFDGGLLAGLAALTGRPFGWWGDGHASGGSGSDAGDPPAGKSLLKAKESGGVAAGAGEEDYGAVERGGA